MLATAMIRPNNCAKFLILCIATAQQLKGQKRRQRPNRSTVRSGCPGGDCRIHRSTSIALPSRWPMSGEVLRAAGARLLTSPLGSRHQDITFKVVRTTRNYWAEAVALVGAAAQYPEGEAASPSSSNSFLNNGKLN